MGRGRGWADWNAEKRFAIVGFAVLPEHLKPMKEGFAFQAFSVFAGKVGNLVEDDDQRVGDERVGGLVPDLTS